MTLQEIFNNDGLYAADSFAKGVAFKIENGTLFLITYESKNDLLPTIEQISPSKNWFDKTYHKIFTIKQLFD